MKTSRCLQNNFLPPEKCLKTFSFDAQFLSPRSEKNCGLSEKYTQRVSVENGHIPEINDAIKLSLLLLGKRSPFNADIS